MGGGLGGRRGGRGKEEASGKEAASALGSIGRQHRPHSPDSTTGIKVASGNSPRHGYEVESSGRGQDALSSPAPTPAGVVPCVGAGNGAGNGNMRS